PRALFVADTTPPVLGSPWASRHAPCPKVAAATGPAVPVIDAHAHVSSRQFDDDRDAALQRAWDAGLVAIVEAGDDVASGQRALKLARREPRVHAVTGLHPHGASRMPEEREALAALLDTGEY